MIRISIQGLKDGVKDIEMFAPVSEIEGIFPEFFGDVKVTGQLRKVSARYTFTGTAESKAHLVCDRSLEDYDEDIKAEIQAAFIKDSESLMQGAVKEQDSEVIILPEDATHIDLTEEVAQQLAVALPMKRISPKYRDKELKDIFPQYSADSDDKAENKDETDPRWSALKNINLGKSDKNKE